MRAKWVENFLPVAAELLDQLDARYGLRRAEFPDDRPDVHDFYQLEGVRILRTTPAGLVLHDVVQSWVERASGEYVVTLESQETLVADAFIDARGYWANNSRDLAPGVSAALRFRSAVAPVMRLWAPYRQLLLVKHCDGYWWGIDGLVVRVYGDDKVARARARLEAAGARDFIGVTRGIRPMVATVSQRAYPHGIFRQPGPRAWVITGGGRNSTLLAAQWARQVRTALGEA